jgi:ATP-binding cassette subfamily F protein 3
MISINNLKVEFSARPLFSDVSFVVNDNDKIALTGKNGAGKSTLLKIIAGLQAPTSGSVDKSEDYSIGYLPQQMVLADDTTVLAETKKAFAKIEEIKRELADLNLKLENLNTDDLKEYEKLITRIEHLNERIKIEDGSSVDGEIEKTLLGLGFERSDFQRPTSEFSGGWRMRIELAKILLCRPDLLLLDEPTNHLDIESIQWLENFLKTKAGAVLLVSHDKAFIDNITNRTIEISCCKIHDYKVNYSQYLVLRQERLEQQMRAYENQQKQIADIKDFIERFRYKPTKSNQVQSRIKMLEKIVPIEVDEVDNSRLRLKFPPAPRSGDYPVICDDVSKAYGDHTVFSHATYTIKRGEKIAFVGKNGHGKSTMVKCIMNEIPYTGELKIGHNIKIGYFAQNQAQLLDGELTVFDTIDRIAVGDIRLRIRDILGAFMFGGEASDKKVKVLSGGEKTRLAMICLLLTPVNLLILDEPTNHLDISSKEVLKDAIKAFDGTAIIVSHDRDFLNGLVDRVYEFSDGEVKENLNGITGFLEKLKMNNEVKGSLREASPTYNSAAPLRSEEPAKTESKLNYEEQKERKRLLSKLQKEVTAAENEIETLETRKQEIEDILASGEIGDGVLEEYATITKSLEAAMQRWEKAQEELEANS